MWIVILIGLAALVSGAGDMAKGGGKPTDADTFELASGSPYRGKMIRVWLVQPSGWYTWSIGQSDPSTDRWQDPQMAEAAARAAVDKAAEQPAGGLEGAGLDAGADESPLSPVCVYKKKDGEFAICIYAQAGGKFGYRADDAGGIAKATGGGYASKGDALVSAWASLLSFPTLIVPAPAIRWGVRLDPDGTVTLIDNAAWLARATPIYQAAINGGESDAAGLVLAVLGGYFPAVNLLRLRVGGEDLDVVAARIEPEKLQPAAAVPLIFDVPAPPPGTSIEAQGVSPIAGGVDLGPSPELLQHAKADGSTWWIVTTGETVTNPSGELQPLSTWRVWGPGGAVAGDPVANGSRATRPAAVAAAKTWIETH